jgi:hypothetical protein
MERVPYTFKHIHKKIKKRYPGVPGGHGEDGDEGQVVGAEVVGRDLAEEVDPHDGV